MELFPSRTVAFELLGWSVHWYGLMYLAAFCIAMWMVPRIQRYRDLHLSRDEWTNIVTWAVLGVIVGGRLGFVFFYEPFYFLERPEKILAVWEGGMSSHGGFLGVTVAFLFALRRRGRDLLRIADIVVVPVAIGLALGRVGNFINMELYGTVMMGGWGWLIPGVPGLRHPWPLYASLMNAVIALICFWHLRGRAGLRPAGKTCALFLMLYGTGRFFLEYVKVQEYALIDIGGVLLLSRGQFLTIGILAVGLWLWGRTSVDAADTTRVS